MKYVRMFLPLITIFVLAVVLTIIEKVLGVFNSTPLSVFFGVVNGWIVGSAGLFVLRRMMR